MKDGITPVLNRVVGRIKGRMKAHTAGDMAVGFIMKHIDDGNGFAALAPATAAYRGKGDPLKDTGTLLRSIKSAVKSDSAVVVFSDLKYARIQNDGGTITAKKQWLFIPGPDTRYLQRRYGYSPAEVLDGLRAAGYSVFRVGRTVCYRKKGSHKTKVAYYLKKSVVIPARRFFYVSAAELALIAQEIGHDIISGS